MLSATAAVPVSATLAANEAMDARRRRGEPVLPLAFGEAGLPAHRLLREALARAAGVTSYVPWPATSSCARRPRPGRLAARSVRSS